MYLLKDSGLSTEAINTIDHPLGSVPRTSKGSAKTRMIESRVKRLPLKLETTWNSRIAYIRVTRLNDSGLASQSSIDHLPIFISTISQTFGTNLYRLRRADDEFLLNLKVLKN